jgi:hypothetical protein
MQLRIKYSELFFKLISQNFTLKYPQKHLIFVNLKEKNWYLGKKIGAK